MKIIIEIRGFSCRTNLKMYSTVKVVPLHMATCWHKTQETSAIGITLLNKGNLDQIPRSHLDALAVSNCSTIFHPALIFIKTG